MVKSAIESLEAEVNRAWAKAEALSDQVREAEETLQRARRSLEVERARLQGLTQGLMILSEVYQGECDCTVDQDGCEVTGEECTRRMDAEAARVREEGLW